MVSFGKPGSPPAAQRSFWQRRLAEALAARRIVWLSGVRRVGKTTLAKALPEAEYHDCELLRVRRALEEPELFWRHRQGLVVLDEVHRLANPSEVLKVAADHFPAVRVIATGSSTLAAKRKFRDSLAGRKRELWLLPMLVGELQDFGGTGRGPQELDRRMLHGGLPPFFLASPPDDRDYQEWLDSYWAKDLAELFVVEKKASFMKFVELLLAQSGGAFEAQALAAPCEISRPTVQHYLSIVETTLLATVLRPYFGGSAREIKSQPKVYGFDTGFVAYAKGWTALRDEDRGLLLEHLVLGELCARFDLRRIHYWRDKQQHEVDFVLEVGRQRGLVAIECKANADKFDPAGLQAFRRQHPQGTNLVIALRQAGDFARRHGDIEVRYHPLEELPALLEALA